MSSKRRCVVAGEILAVGCCRWKCRWRFLMCRLFARNVTVPLVLVLDSPKMVQSIASAKNAVRTSAKFLRQGEKSSRRCSLRSCNSIDLIVHCCAACGDGLSLLLFVYLCVSLCSPWLIFLTTEAQRTPRIHGEKHPTCIRWV